MKRLMVANLREGMKRYSDDKMVIMLKAQIQNCLELGWNPKNIIVLSNFDFEFMDIKAIKMPMNEICLTGSKIFALNWLFDHSEFDEREIIYAADLDCWQNVWFDCPEFSGDVGAAQYSNPKFNGGSIFWKLTSKDIIKEVVKRITDSSENKEEPMLNKVFKSDEYKDRITILDHTYNVGCSGFIPRYSRSMKPIHVCHFHPNNTIAWEIHALDRVGIGEVAVTVRLERLLRQYYPHLKTKITKPIGNKKRKDL